MLEMFVFVMKRKLQTVWIFWFITKSICIVRESNPGRPRGRRAFYHWTNDAFLLRWTNLKFLISSWNNRKESPFQQTLLWPIYFPCKFLMSWLKLINILIHRFCISWSKKAILWLVALTFLDLFPACFW